MSIVISAGLTAFVVFPLVSSAAIVTCSGPVGGENPCDFRALGVTLISLIKYVVTLGLIFSTIAFAWAGFLYLKSGGDSGKVQEAHQVFQKVLVGFIISVSAYIIINLLLSSDALDLNDEVIQKLNMWGL